MARPLWKDMRHHRAQDRSRAPSKRRPDAHYGAAILSAIGALAAVVVGFNFQRYLHRAKTDPGGFAVLISSAAAFVIFGSYATRRFANEIGRLLAEQGGRAAGSAVRLIATLLGLLIVIFTAIGMLGVSASKLLVGGAITGVVVGIAAQQSLGNIFAGIVLIVARPFTVGSRIRVRSGSLGGVFDAEVSSIGLTYVVLETEDGALYVPNLTMLSAGVVQLKQDSGARPSPLYVNRSLPKRPPRHPVAPQRHPPAGQPAGQPAPRAARLPRELVRRMRERRLLEQPGTGLASGPPSGAGAPRPGAPGESSTPPVEGQGTTGAEKMGDPSPDAGPESAPGA